MTDAQLPLRPADLHYTALISLLWQLYERTQELGLPTLATDLVVASNELRNGPWRHLGDAPGRLSLPFTPACLLVDHLLDQLQAASSGLAARAAIELTRQILDGNRPHDTSRRHF
jgi:hypothetical protein